jgi:hypothetical protein
VRAGYRQHAPLNTTSEIKYNVMPDTPDKPIGTYRPDAIDIAVENLVTACGFDKSESASECFYSLLQEAVDELDGTIEKSHDEGLCYDMTHALSGTLRELLKKQSGLLN